MIPAPLQSSEASAARSRSQPSKRRESPSSGSTGTVETQTMKLSASGGAALRVRTFDTPQQTAAAITSTKASTGPLAPSSTAATPMPASATAMPMNRTRPGRPYEPDIGHQAEENHTQLALLAAGLGVAMIPRLGRGPLPDGVVAVRMDPVPVRRLYALWRTEAARRPAITAAVAALQAHGAAVGLRGEARGRAQNRSHP